MMKTNKNIIGGIQTGDKIQIQDQFILFNNFNTINIIVNNPKKDIPFCSMITPIYKLFLILQIIFYVNLFLLSHLIFVLLKNKLKTRQLHQ